MKTIEDIKRIVSQVRFKSHEFHIGEWEGRCYLQVQYNDTDIHTGKVERQNGRKWDLSLHATDSEIVQTAFKAIMASQEHIAREFFTFQGQRVYSPHYDVYALVELCKSVAFDERE